MISLLGKDLSTSSFSLYTFSAAVLVQAIVLVLFSSYADHGKFYSGFYLSTEHC